MNATTLHIKTDVKTRDEAKKIAEEFGFSLTSLVNALLKQVARTKQLNLNLDETPNAYMQEALRESEEDVKAGRVHSFTKPKDALNFINDLITGEKHKKPTLT